MKSSNVDPPDERAYAVTRGHLHAGRAGSSGINFTNPDASEIDDVFDVTLVGLRGDDLDDGAMRLVAELGLSNITTITPTQLTTNTDDWAPVDATYVAIGLPFATIVRAATDASRNLTGLVAPDPAIERVVILENVGAFDLVLKHDVTSTAANRLYCPNDVDLTLQKDSAVVLEYDVASARWRVLAKPDVSLATLAPTTFTFPGATSPAQTAEGSAVWDTDDDVLTVGDGASRKTFGYVGSSAPSGGYGTAAAGSSKEVLRKDAVLAKPTAADVDFSADVTTNDVTTGHHGLAPKAPNDATKFLDGTGAYSTPSSSGGSATPFTEICSVYGAAQSLANGAEVAIACNAENYDPTGMHDTVTNNSRITIATTGKYHVSAQLTFATNGTSLRGIEVRLNGGGLYSDFRQAMPSPFATYPSVSVDIALTAGDYLEVWGYQNSGGALNAQVSYFTVHRIA